MPGPVVEPVPELLKPIGDEVLGSPEVEPRVDYGKPSQYRDLRQGGWWWDFVGDEHSCIMLSKPGEHQC